MMLLWFLFKKTTLFSVKFTEDYMVELEIYDQNSLHVENVHITTYIPVCNIVTRW